MSGDLTSAFDFSRADSKVPALPDTSSYQPPDHDRRDDYVPTPPAHPTLPRQEAGQRPAVPLPYDLAADGAATAGKLRISFANHGGAGAHFLVTSAGGAEGPWTYTVEAGRNLTGDWEPATGQRHGYDLTVHGPNGFLRQFAGCAEGPGPEVAARHDRDSGDLQLVLTNDGHTSVELTVKDGYGKEHPARYRVRPGARVVHTVHTGRSHGWYDLSVTSDREGDYLRRLAGHVETGRVGMSDPAIGRH